MEVPEARGGLLVVDDEPFLREAVAASLRFLGFQVTTADTAAAPAVRSPVNLVVLDGCCRTATASRWCGGCAGTASASRSSF